MSKRESTILLQDIKDSLAQIARYIFGLNKTEFLENQLVQDAVVRNLEIIGEAAKNLPAEFRQGRPQVNWRGLAGLRDVVIHGYFNVDLEMIWEIVYRELPLISKNLDK